MIEFFLSIPGPIFLIVYIVYAVVVIRVVKVYVSRDYTCDFEIPEPTKFDPLDIAILSKGVKGAIATAVFNLWRLKGVDISTNKKSLVLKSKPIKTTQLNKLEYSIYSYLKSSKYYSFLFKSASIKSIEKIIEPNINRLKRFGLAANERVLKHYWKGISFGVLALLAFGGIKLYLGVVRDKPVAFLILLMFFSVVALIIAVNPIGIRTSALGKKLLDTTKNRFEWMKSSSKGEELLMDNNLLYVVAMFGISSFVGSNPGGILEQIKLLDRQSVASVGGTTVGCSGCSGGCSSGCGGGGCGGCGG